MSAESELFENKYILAEVLGSGGMGTVYSATQVSLGRNVAIKLPHPALAGNPNVSHRFRAEARAGGQLDHPNIARVIDLGGTDGALFLVMEYVRGGPLDKLVAEQGPLEPRVAVELTRQLLAALDAAHAAGILHADVKTANILIESTEDAPPHARLIDFGLARFSNESTPRGEHLLSGTPEYLAPELIEGGQPSIASDLYAAGVVLYELLTGFTPFGGGSSDDIMQRHLEGSPSPPSLRNPDQDIPFALDAVVMRALTRDPRGRFVSAAEFSNALLLLSSQIGPARIARGSQTAGHSTESITRDWHRPPSVLTLLPPLPEPSIAGLREAVNRAIACGDGDPIVAAYLDLVRALVDAHALSTAVSELEHGVGQLRVEGATATPLAMWRLQLCLAALYSGIGDHRRAGDAARAGREDAVRALSSVGQDRASELLIRLARQARNA